MRFASVCSGIGAPEVAWRSLGWQCQFVSETAQFPSAVLAHRFEGVPNLGDMTEIDGEKWNGQIDALAGGTPCQGFSVAGQRGGMDDGRSRLAYHYVEFLRSCRPRWFVWENVTGVLSSNKGRDFEAILRAMAGCGYGVVYRVLDTSTIRTTTFPGAIPQHRRRVFVVGHSRNWRCSAAVLLDRKGSDRNSPSRGRERQDNPAGIEARARIGDTLNGAITAHFAKGTSGFSGDECYNLIVDDGEARRLLPSECERLQGFPTDWTRIPYRGKPADRCPDAPRYEALGNAMSVNVMEYVGRRMAFVDAVDRARHD